ncbi:MAG: SDR family oxidoreductase [Alphaproteobacteria bacterium]|nr:SDR family oxidoreductase [Alphaproteobacteria bacterium]
MSAPSLSLTGRVALVTGASAGLGAHFARVLATAGAQVVITARRIDRIAALAADIAATGGAAHAIAIDVTDAASVSDGIRQAVAVAGGIDLLVNNAGIAVPRGFLDTVEAEWQSVIDTNLSGYMRVGREAAKAMVAGGKGGAIVNVASVLGMRVGPHLASYSAAKAGVISLTQSMALELARHGIRVNALAPGYIETDLNRGFLTGPGGQALVKRVPMRRFGALEDLDGPLLLLLSDAGRFMTGATVTVDGGHTLSLF